MGKGVDRSCSSIGAKLGGPSAASRAHPRRDSQDRWILDEQQGIAMIADGMGGHQGGQDAAELAVGVVRAGAYPLPPEGERQGSAAQLLLNARSSLLGQRTVNQALFEADATAVVALRDGEHLEVAWCGDSRAYLLRESKLQSLTLDHAASLRGMPPHRQREIQDALDRTDNPSQLQGELRDHYRSRNRVSSGVSEGAIGEVGVLLRAGDRILLCSDGISDNLSLEEIQQALDTPGALAEELVDRAYTRSRSDHPRAKQDDITALILDWA